MSEAVQRLRLRLQIVCVRYNANTIGLSYSKMTAIFIQAVMCYHLSISFSRFLLLFLSGPFTKDDYNQGKKGLQDGISNLNDSIGSFGTEDPNFLIIISKI